jgi:hypothetical protein
MAAGADVFIVGTSGLFNHGDNIHDAWQVMAEQILAAKRGISSCKNSVMSSPEWIWAQPISAFACKPRRARLCTAKSCAPLKRSPDGLVSGITMLIQQQLDGRHIAAAW